jgi:hypothetical protein
VMYEIIMCRGKQLERKQKKTVVALGDIHLNRSINLIWRSVELYLMLA